MKDLLIKSEYQLVVKYGTLSDIYFTGATAKSNPLAKTIYDEKMKDNPDVYEMKVKDIEERLLQVRQYTTEQQ